MADPPESPTSPRWNSNLAVAVIAAVAAVAGAAVGGFATYYGNYKLQKSQNYAAAKGAARVLQGDLAGVATRLQLEQEKRQYFAPPTGPVITITAEDEKEIAANVSASTWNRITAAKLTIQEEQESASDLSNIEVLEARNHQTVALTGPRLGFVQGSLKIVAGATVALKELTGTYSDE